MSIYDITNDSAWRPEVPIGHTGYTWGEDSNTEATSSGEVKLGFNGKPIALPVAGERNILITAALPYVNNVPHLGNIIGCVLSADVYARYCRLRDYNSLFICGTDEYGTATETKAQQEGMTPQQICDKYNAIHTAVYKWFDISFDHFGRTTTPKQTEIAQDIFNRCDTNGFVHAEPVSQLYCESCVRFLADRFVCGTCPLCGYDDAKGDQCDKCSHLINATELIKPRCTTCQATPIVKVSEHLFLDLPQLSTDLEAFVRKNEQMWSMNSVAVTNSWLKNGLKPRCITRDLKWGTPVPKEGFTDKVFYVWFDAPIGYISITANATDDWEKWWKNPEEVELVQFMGKDNVPFHTVIFPSTCIAAKDNYTLLNRLSTTEYLNYEGTKFSKTRGIGVFGDQVMETGIPAEVWRYYLLHNRPEQSDAMFLWDDFASKANTDLPNALGNLVQRSLSFIKARYDGKVPGATSPLTAAEFDLEKEVNEGVQEYIKLLDEQHLKDALKVAMNVAFIGNKYMQSTKPWELIKNDVPRCDTVLAVIVQLINLLAVLFEPFMPSFSQKVLAQLNLPLATTGLSHKTFTTWNLSKYVDMDNTTISCLNVPVGHIIGTPEPIFRKVEATQIEELRKKYAGAQNTTQEGADFPLDIIAGTIQEIENHPSNPKCYVLKVSIGEEKPRQIVANLAGTYTTEQLLQKKVLILNNLKFSKFGGVLSEGMLMTAIHVTDAESKAVPLAPVSLTVKDGMKILPKGCKAAPVKVFDVKKKISELKLSVGDASQILFGGLEWQIDGDLIVADGVPEGSRVC